MCTASSVRQWGLSVKEKYGNFFESPGKDPRVEWAACCDSEVPLSRGAGAEAGLRMLLEAPQLWVEHCMSWAAVLFLQLGVLMLICLLHTLGLFWQTLLSTF